MKGRIGTQTTLFALYPKSLVDKLRYVNDVQLTKEAKLRLKWIEYYEKVKDVTKSQYTKSMPKAKDTIE